MACIKSAKKLWRIMKVRSLAIVTLLISSSCLAGCTTYPFEELVEQGQEKKQFIKYMRNFGFGQYESIYFDQEKGVEILIPRIHLHEHYSWKNFKYSDDEPRLVIFNKVTEPLPYRPTIDPELFQEFCNEWNPNPLKCAYYGDGVLHSWFSEVELSEQVALGDGDAKLLLSALQLRYDFIDNLIGQVMQNQEMTEAEAREAIFWSEFQRDREHEEAGLELAKKGETTPNQQYTYINKADKNKSVARSQSDNERNPEYGADRTMRSQPVENTQASSSLENSMGSLFGRLIAAALEAYVDDKLGLNTSSSSLSKSDLEKIEEASRRGMRRADQQRKRKNNMKWTAPIAPSGY